MTTPSSPVIVLTTEERLVRTETELEFIKESLSRISADVAEIKKAAHMGRGAWAVILRLGGFILVVLALYNWFWDHVLPHWASLTPK